MSDLRSSARVEYLPVDKAGERRDKATGFRLALVPAAIPSPARLQNVRALWSSLAQTIDPNQTTIADPAKEIDALAQSINDPNLKRRVESVGATVKANIQARNEHRDRSTKSELRLASYLCKKVIEDRARIRAIENIVTGPLPEELKAGHRNNLRFSKEALENTLSYLSETIKQLSLDYGSTGISSQSETLKREFEARKAPPEYGPIVDLVVRLTVTSRSGKVASGQEIEAELGKLVTGARKPS